MAHGPGTTDDTGDCGGTAYDNGAAEFNGFW